MAKETKAPKINRHKSMSILLDGIERNNAKFNERENYIMRVRGNEATVMERIMYDLVNAYEKRRVYEFYNPTIQLPAVVRAGDACWLYTANALIAHAQKGTLKPSTVGEWLKQWKRAINDGIPKLDFVLEVKNVGNDVALRINTAYIVMEEEREAAPSTHPHKPPDTKGKADIEQGSITPAMLEKLKRRVHGKYHG